MKIAAVSFRFSSVAKALLKEISEKLGISQTSVLEILIREKAEKLKGKTYENQ